MSLDFDDAMRLGIVCNTRFPEPTEFEMQSAFAECARQINEANRKPLINPWNGYDRSRDVVRSRRECMNLIRRVYLMRGLPQAELDRIEATINNDTEQL